MTDDKPPVGSMRVRPVSICNCSPFRADVEGNCLKCGRPREAPATLVGSMRVRKDGREMELVSRWYDSSRKTWVEMWDFTSDEKQRVIADVGMDVGRTGKAPISYGHELIVDLHDCAGGPFGRASLNWYFFELCDLIDMERHDLHFWDYDDEEERAEAPVHLAGITAIQFIATSNITVHTLDRLREVYINIFSCREFDFMGAVEFSKAFFSARGVEHHTFMRGVGAYQQEGIES